MKIKSGLKIRNVAGESIVMLRGGDEGGTSKLISFNPTSVYLWESLSGREFTTRDVCSLLMEKYDVAESVAAADAGKWVASLEEAGVFE